ncbi:sensor histidine kinase [Bosea sp. PAMC 26642]|uniref:sensor histidine kinase n=1 Tax=Bosea sp. (strain PAMC 26642) TaxID=1792307 RepID=UPI00077032AC|nr:sensor histidine kinase [Bosea sp. PAMC 26642]AMJ62525.1 hypothetical protein AXW83_21445 [Bosea sp. PAMC 26642]
MRLTAFKTVRGRLLALLVAIALPIACVTAIAAITTYRTVIAAIEASQARAADDFAIRTRVWYRGALRSLLASTATISVDRASLDGCERIARTMLTRVQGYRALHMVLRDGRTCDVSLDSSVSTADLAAGAAMLRTRPPIVPWGGAELSKTRYDTLTVSDKRYLAVYARNENTEQDVQEALLLVDPLLLDQVFDLGEDSDSLLVALVTHGGDIVTARGLADRDANWLPAIERAPQERARWEAQSRDGRKRAYAARMVAEPDFYVIASFDDAPALAARTQFLALLIAPLLTLVLLCVVYMRAIDNHCIRWLREIETAARARAGQKPVRAAVADDMPSDIRSVADAFNHMVEDQEVRQRRLQTALDDNRFLVRELHHRVKNSLQVVQSYIGLTKRDYRGEARLALSDAECRVHVLSAAYRFTLADGEMQPVRIDLFLDDVVTMMSNLMRRRDQWITSRIETRALLTVDRIIPLGFLIVDVVSRALRDTPGVSISIHVGDIDASTIEIALNADRDIAHTAPPKLFAGLVAQIEATQTTAPQGAMLGVWRVSHAA